MQAIISQNKIATILISLHHHNGSILVYSDSMVQRGFIFSICDKPDISSVSRLGKFAFVGGMIVKINQIAEVKNKVSL